MSKKVLTTTKINKIIRQEGLCGSNRLPSFGLPRNLSLGGTKTERSYTPNFNAIRNKGRSSHLVVKQEQSSHNPENRGLKRPFNGVRNNKHGKYIETEGIFSKGMGKVTSFPRSYSVKTSSAKDRQNIDALDVPKVSSTDFMQIKDEDDFEPAPSLKYNLDSNEVFQALRVIDPVTYEFNANDKQLTAIKNVKCNGELCDTDNTKKTKTEFEKEIRIPPVAYSAFSATATFSDNQHAFSLFKFPDALLGFPGLGEETHSNLKDLPEGQIGKLIIRKSGKMEMNINNIRHTVTQDMIHGFHQAMLFPGQQSMSTEPSLVTLGTLTEKYTVTPDWKEIFQKVSSRDVQ